MLFLVFGGRGTGKTELEKQISYFIASTGGLVFVFDPIGQWPRGYRQTPENLNQASAIPRLNAFPTAEAFEVADIAQATGQCLAIFDEVDFLCTAQAWKSESGRDIALRGRHSQVALVIAGQRSVNCHGDLKSLCDKVAVFRLMHPNDLEVFEKWLGPEYAEQIRNLNDHEFVLWPDGLVCKMGLNGPAMQRSFTVGDDEDGADDDQDEE